jgi:hypothetical protein
MPYVKQNGVGVYEEPNPSEMMIKLYDSGIEITKWCHCKMSKLDKQRDIAMYKRDIKEEESE